MPPKKTYSKQQSSNMLGLPGRLYTILLFYHLLFTVAFHYYLLSHGGDSIAYWNFSIVNYRPATNWMDYFEYGNFFMQWLNYLPSQVLGLPYWAGNLIYGLISFLGFAELLRLCLSYWGWKEGKLLENAWILALFLPGIHFWTAGVGKEAVLWLGTIWVLKGNTNPWKKGHWVVLGLFLTLMTRPIHGTLLLSGTFINLLLDQRMRRNPYGWLWIGVVLAGGVVAFAILLRQTHLPNLSPSSITAFFNSQQAFLERFGAGSYLPMQEYAWPQRIWAVLFRPLPWEAQGVWQWTAAAENTLLLILTVTASSLLIWKRPAIRIPNFLVFGLLLSGCMFLLFTTTLNNFGIFMRMKSIFLPFIVIFFLKFIAYSNKQTTLKGNV